MTHDKFVLWRETLVNSIIGDIRADFEKEGVDFNEAAFREAAEESLRDIVGDAFFYGAELFPGD